MAELVPEAAKAGQKPQAQAAPDLAKGPATLSLDLSAPDEKLLEGLHKQGMHGRLDVLYRIQLTTADQQNASFQFGQSQPQITSVSQSQFGQSNSVTMNRTGMTLEIQPRVAGSTVSMKVNLEGSRLGRAEEGVPLSVPSKGESVRVPPSYQVTLKTAVNVPDGQTIALGGLTEQDGPRKRQLVVLVCPRVIPSVNPRHPDRPAR
jgi:type II secretory pathway component GspD/PulD (secretin)